MKICQRPYKIFVFRLFWQNLRSGSSSIYASDHQGGWLRKKYIQFGNVLDAEIGRRRATNKGELGKRIDGITSTNLYLGYQGNYACIHPEDCDLYSLNIHVSGEGEKVKFVESIENLVKITNLLDLVCACTTPNTSVSAFFTAKISE